MQKERRAGREGRAAELSSGVWSWLDGASVLLGPAFGVPFSVWLPVSRTLRETEARSEIRLWLAWDAFPSAERAPGKQPVLHGLEG